MLAPADARRDGLTAPPTNAGLLGSIGTTKSIPVPNMASVSSGKYHIFCIAVDEKSRIVCMHWERHTC